MHESVLQLTYEFSEDSHKCSLQNMMWSIDVDLICLLTLSHESFVDASAFLFVVIIGAGTFFVSGTGSFAVGL